MSKKISIDNLEKKIQLDNSVFICCSSFETRSIIIPNALKNKNFNSIYVFQNTNLNLEIEKNANTIKEYYCGYGNIVCTKIDNPLITASAIKTVIDAIIENNIKNIIIDITTFTHEMLLILLMNIYKNKNIFDNILFLYLGAKDYSINEKIEEKWLSKGCKQIRSIVGYPGKLIPSLPVCLIVLVGYEHERAEIVIEEMEPEYLMLGKGLPSEESLTNPSHKVPMIYFQNILENFISRQSGTGSFDFSCSNLQSTYIKIKEEIAKKPGVNHIIIPLNTKISTLAAGIVALENNDIQICYAEPETYNFYGYSTPDNYVTVLNNIFDFLT